MPSDWTSTARNSVQYGYRWPDGTSDTCANDAYSIVRASLDGLSQMGVVSPGAPVFSPGYFGSLAQALQTSRQATLNEAYADSCLDATRLPPGSTITDGRVLQAIVWSAYYFVGADGQPGAGSPASVVIPTGTVPPRAGDAPVSENGQFNDSACAPGSASTPPGVAGARINPLLVLGVIVGGGLIVNAINARAPRVGRLRK